jgi:hypothetical protein
MMKKWVCYDRERTPQTKRDTTNDKEEIKGENI